MTFRKTVIFLILLLTASLLPAAAEEAAESTGFAEKLKISLTFIGPADALYSSWGHVAVIIENTESGASRYYDYGNFSFEQDSFIRNFVMGRLYFLKMASNAERQLKYNSFLNRDVTIYELNVRPENRLKLFEFLENDILPENRIYLYDHFYDNCSTRIRDMMDIITDGEFSSKYTVESDKTLRMQIRRFIYNQGFIDWLLNFAMKGAVDKPATVYEGMFLPLELEKGVTAMMVTNEAGERIPFVKSKEIINLAEGRPAIVDYPPSRWPYGLILGLILAAGAWLLQRKSDRVTAKRKLYAVYSMLLAFFLAIPGSLLFFMAIFTDHSFAYWNMNLLFINPFLFVVFGFSIRILADKKSQLQSLQRSWRIIAVGAVLSIILKIIPFCRQANWESILIVLPAAIVFSGALSSLSSLKPRADI